MSFAPSACIAYFFFTMRPLTSVFCLVTLVAVLEQCKNGSFVAASATPNASSLGSPAKQSDEDVRVLTDANFELETQAVTGSTSGTY